MDKCNNKTGNGICDYTVDKPRQCNFEERNGCSYLDCEYCQKENDNMFEKVFIGKLDINNNKIHEGDRLKFKSIQYKNREFEGIVKYNKSSCQFCIERDNDEGHFLFYADIYDIEIVR